MKKYSKLLLLVLPLLILQGCGPTAEEKKAIAKAAAETAEKARIEKYIEAAKEDVLKTLKDPASAQFSNMKPVPHSDGKVNERSHICGRVNAKNSMGGYTGAKDFLYVPTNISKVQYISYVGGGNSYTRWWEEGCR